MSLFKLRPLAFGCFVFLICLYLSYFLGNFFNIIIIALGALTLITLVILNFTLKHKSIEKWLIRSLATCICLIACGVLSACTFSRDKKIEAEYADTEREMAFFVTELVYSEEYGSVAIAKTEGENRDFELLLAVEDNKISVGDKVKASVTLRRLEDSQYGYSEHDNYADDGIFLCAEAEEYEITSQNNFVLGEIFRRINSFLVGIVKDSVNSDTASLISAMLLGNRDDLADNVSRDFSRLGISHILALSGIHLSLITSMASVFLSTIQTPKRSRYVLLILMIIAFVCITGFSKSAMRAGFMLILYYTMLLIGDMSDSATSLFASAVIICILDPYSIFSLSLLLSFTAMLACVCAGALTKHERALYRIRPKFVRSIIYTLITSLAVMLLTLPIMFIKLGGVSIFSPLFNLIFVPLLTVLLYLSPFVLILGKIPYVSYIVKYPAELLTKLVLFLTGNVSKADFLSIPFAKNYQAIGVYIILAGMILALVFSKKKIKFSIITVAVGVLAFVATTSYIFISRENKVTISSEDYFPNDMIAVESKNEVMVISASNATPTFTCMVARFGQSLGYSDIDTYVFTDYGYYIIDSFDKLTNMYMVRNVKLPTPMTDKEREQYDAIEKLCQEKGIALSKTEEKVDFGQTCVDFMEYQRLGRSTKRCVAFSISAYNARFTYLGASSYECGSYFPGNYVNASDIVLFGSYGPPYKLKHSYDLSSVDYVVLHYSSQDYVTTEIPEEKLVPSGSKFIFKVS